MRRSRWAGLGLAATFLGACGGGDADREVRAEGQTTGCLAVTSYDDDPFVADARVQCLDPASVEAGADGRPILSGARARLGDEPVIYREDPAAGEFKPFATNPWPCVVVEVEGYPLCEPPRANPAGDFTFADEPRFPPHEIERDEAGAPVIRDGLQQWKPRAHFRGFATAFEALHAALGATEEWAGRELPWGDGGRIHVNVHALIDFNSFYAPSVRQIFFGVAPYRLPGAPPTVANIRMFELGTSWDIAAHEAGHALHAELKPNRDPSDPGYKTWSESFCDQLAMWVSLRDPDRSRALLAETGGELDASNSLSRFVEAFGAIVGQGFVAMRDAVHAKKVSETSGADRDEHDRSEPLTGAAYRLFLAAYGARRGELGDEAALAEAREVAGTFLVRAADHVPENVMTLEDVGKAYLKVDKEAYLGRFRAVLVDELQRREILGPRSVEAWEAHEASLPRLTLAGTSPEQIDALVQGSLDALGVSPELGLVVQRIDRDRRFGVTIVRVQLTRGRGPGSETLENHGSLVFRRDGTLADYFPALPGGVSASQAVALLGQARRMRLDRHGGSFSVVRGGNGRATIEVRPVQRRTARALEVFTLDRPDGEWREVVPTTHPGGRAAREALLEAGVLVDPAEVTGR